MKRALILTCLLILGTQNSRAVGEPAVIGYLPSYSLATAKPEQFRGVTDVIFFSLEPEADGAIGGLTLDADSEKKLEGIRRVSQCRMLICVGGWGKSKYFPTMAAKEETRRRFISGMLRFCQQHGFEGIDYDWEHPKDQAESTNYSKLLIETAKVFHSRKLVVTIAQAGFQDLGEEAYAALDRIHYMCYDQAFPQATMAHASRGVEALARAGCPKGKVALGVPFYGRNEKRESITYAALIRDKSITPEMDIIDGYAFNNKSTLSKKIDFIKRERLAGIMIWELTQDTPEEKASLLHHILAMMADAS